MIYKVRNEVITPAVRDNVIDFLENNSIIALDSETQGFDCHTKKLLSLQLGNETIQFVIDFQSEDCSFLVKYLKDENKLWLLFNAKFDNQFLLKNLGVQPAKVYDAFLAECLLYAGYEKGSIDLSLKGVAQRYCNVTLDKTIRGQINYKGINDPTVILYGAKDVAYLHEIREKQLVAIDKWQLNKVLDLENQVVRVLAKMEYDGILLDTVKWKEIANITEKNTKESQSKLDDIIVKEAKSNIKLQKYINTQTNLFDFEEPKTRINWSSSSQKVEILNKIGIKVEDTSDATLQKLKSNEIIKELLVYNKNAKLASTYGKEFLKFVNPITKRVHTNHYQILSTGRMSQNEPALSTIPAHGTLSEAIKNCFIASEGWSIVGFDYSAFELRIIAQLSLDPLWVNIFKEGRDLHSELCSKTFNIPIDKVKDPFPEKPDISYRFLQKTINFGLAYGMSKYKLAETAQIPVNKAEEIINKFFKVVPTVKKFLDMLGELGKSNGYIRTDGYFKRVRFFPNKDESNFKIMGEIERASKNTIPQGVNASVTKLALIWLQKVIDDNNYPVRILLDIHDSIITECKDEFAEEWYIIMQSIMIGAGEVILKDVPTVVDGYIGKSWKK